MNIPSTIHQKIMLECRKREFKEDPNKRAIGYGFKKIGGKRTGDYSIQYFVKRKSNNVTSKNYIPRSHSTTVPVYSEIQTDVVQSDFKTPDVSKESLPRVAYYTMMLDHGFAPGGSIGNYATGFTGTITAILEDQEGQLYGVSNYHVLADQSLPNETIIAPGPADNNDVNNFIGTLDRFNLNNRGDWALVKLNERRKPSPWNLWHRWSHNVSVRDPIMGEVLMLNGRTSRKKFAQVTWQGYAKIPYVGIGEVIIGCFMLEPIAGLDANISTFGDSGGSWSSLNEWIGIHFAGSDEDPEQGTQEMALACFSTWMLADTKMKVWNPIGDEDKIKTTLQ